MNQAVMPFAARRDRSLDLPGQPEAPTSVRFRQGRTIIFAFSPWAGERAGRWCVLYGPQPRAAAERLAELLARPAADLRAQAIDDTTCEVFADTPLSPTRPLALIEGMGAPELNDLLETMERWAC